MADYCSACGALQEYAPNFVVNGITDKECNSLQNNTGLNPDLENLHNNCQDLNDMLDCLIGALQDKLPAYDVCDWKEYTDELMSNIYNLQKAIICSECGQWVKIHELEDSIEKLWEKMAKVEDALDNIAAQNWEVNTRYEIEHATPGMSVSIERSTGNFVFDWSDWNDTAGTELIGRGKVAGTINFGMGQESGLNARWQIREIVINTCSYVTASNPAAVQNFTINLYVPDQTGGTRVYQKNHTGMTNFSDTINKKVSYAKNGTLAAGANSGWIQFLEFFNDIASTSLDDRANVQIQFVNANKSSVPPYI